MNTSTNSVHVDGARVVCTPTDLSSRYPTHVVKQAPGVFLVRANIVLTNGATLQVAGGADGDTDQLRLLSNNRSPLATVNVTADWGKVRFQNTKVTSWDEAAKGADTEYGGHGRAFVRVRSRYVGGVAYTSRMDIVNSDIGYLGYYAPESYGLTWKVLGTDFAKVDVHGNITGSRLHHNYFGAYTFGASRMIVDNNEVDHNVMYGLDPHDDSDSLTITRNRSHHNGAHGIICSKRCDHLVIRGNRSYNNAGHGIMLHRMTDDNLVENNYVKSNAAAGIALFESNNNVVRNNHIGGNAYGLRLSVGSSDNSFRNNAVIGARVYGVYTYKGSDAPARSGNDGINRRNTWTRNLVKGTGRKIMRLGATSHDIFDGNDFRGNPRVDFDLTDAIATNYRNNQTDPGSRLGGPR